MTKLEKVLAIARKIVDAEADRHWLLQHGAEEGQTFEQVKAGVDLLNSKITKLRTNLLDLIEEE